MGGSPLYSVHLGQIFTHLNIPHPNIQPVQQKLELAATDADNRLVAVTPDGTATFVAGAPDEMTLAGSVAPGFGTLPKDTDTLYVAKSGAMVFPVNGTIIEGGKIVAVDTRGFLPNHSTKESRPVIGFYFPSGSWPEYLLQMPMRYLSYLLK
ncbi:hypothetical protein N7467_002827 [Penicillium canescens]|nr:hypothetical protein N7467_002827 [Penicillium canescens]